jgi:galactokinase/mevalonate kinase-like predicted kinase
LTAANDIQADNYRRQIAWRRQHQLLPGETGFAIIADPGGQRIGSGGSTLYALQQMLQQNGSAVDKTFAGKRILILHSGGDSRRLPAWSPIGKIFVPLPSKRYQTLFDIMIHNYAELPRLDEGQVIVASGDVLLNFEAEAVQFEPHGVTGLAYPDVASVAQNHGVYLIDDLLVQHNFAVVAGFLQKPDQQQLQKHRPQSQKFWIDTGIVHLSYDAVNILLQCQHLVQAVENGHSFNLYSDFIDAFLQTGDIPDAGKLGNLPFYVSLLPYCGFFHVGRTREFVDNLYTITHASTLYRFANSVRSNALYFSDLKTGFVYNSFIESDDSSVTSPAVVEGCHIDQPLHLQGENLLTGVPAGCGDIRLDKGICLSVFPLQKNDWCAVIYGMDDVLKYDAGDERCTFMNQSIKTWMQERKLDDETLWPDCDSRSLWQAQLFPCSKKAKTAVELALQLAAGDLSRWKNASRCSMTQILQQLDPDRALQLQNEIQRRAMLANLADEMTPDSDWTFESLIQLCKENGDYINLAGVLLRLQSKSHDLLFKSRLQYLLSRLSALHEDGVFDKNKTAIALHEQEWQDKAFADIGDAVERGLEKFDTSIVDPHLAIRSDEVVWISLPARLDFAGGWSDTPPYCLQQGGSVLNAAIKLNNQYPIQVIGKRLEDPVIRINSIDLGATVTVSDLSQMLTYTDPSDWTSLVKSAFFASGVISQDYRGELTTLLKNFGGGIDLTLFSALPSGSGLGTSSILGAGIISCLSTLFGIQLSTEELFVRTSITEQLMTTGGGWQDQIGGVVGGVKLIRTRPGFSQMPRLSWTSLSFADHNSEDRFLLYYTGYRRMAKNILRHIVGRFLDHDPETLHTVEALKQLSVDMKRHLDNRDIDAFGRSIARAWTLNKILDVESTTDEINAILKQIDDYILGAKLLGAGGGGFLFIVAKDQGSKRRIIDHLQQHPPNDRARFFDFQIDSGGLFTSVL